jgi:hypothetical protein
MFNHPTIVGSWPTLVARLENDGVLARWADAEPDLAGLTAVSDLLAVCSDTGEPERSNAVLAALVRLAAVDGGRDEDALLLLLHLLSGLVWAMVGQLRHLSPDIVAVVVGELACQIRRYPWRRRPRAIAANLRAETRRGVLAELRPRSRRHPERGEFLTAEGDVTRLLARQTGDESDDVDVVDLLEWAVRSGVDATDIAMLVATETHRDRRRGGDSTVACCRYLVLLAAVLAPVQSGHLQSSLTYATRVPWRCGFPAWMQSRGARDPSVAWLRPLSRRAAVDTRIGLRCFDDSRRTRRRVWASSDRSSGRTAVTWERCLPRGTPAHLSRVKGPSRGLPPR